LRNVYKHYIYKEHLLIVMPGAPKRKRSKASTARNNAVAGEGSSGGGGGLACGEEEGQNAAGVEREVPCGGQDVEKNAVGKDTVADNGENVMMSPGQFLQKARNLQRQGLDLAKQDNSLPFASALGQHGAFPISFKLILSLLTNDNFPPGQLFSWVLQRCENAKDYHTNSIILSFPQIYAKHAIISVSVFTAQWYICSGPDTHPLTVNNVSVRQDQVLLRDGDIIVIGDVELKFACGVQ